MRVLHGMLSAVVALTSTLAHAEVSDQYARVASSTGGQHAVGRLLVIPRDATTLPSNGMSGIGLVTNNSRISPRAREWLVTLPAGVDEKEIRRRLLKTNRYTSVELDMQVAPTYADPNLSDSWAIPKIGADVAWSTSTGTGVTVAVLDTGVRPTHPDLITNLVPGWNAYSNNSDSADVHGHGTQVAGVIGAAANTIGSVGVAHGARIMPIRITDDRGYAFFSTIVAAIHWAADNGARVANISFSGVATSPTIASAAQYMRDKGGVVVVAAGNSGGVIPGTDYPEVIVVGASTQTDTRASFSSFGDFVDVVAPGVSIFTTTNQGGYGYSSGTSFASPVVAAVAALMISANPSITPTDVEDILQRTAVDLGPVGRDQMFGSGRVDASTAVDAAIAVDNTPPTLVFPQPTYTVYTNIASTPITVDASDDHSVSLIEFTIDGHLQITPFPTSHVIYVSGRLLKPGSHTLTAAAHDESGNISTVSTTLDVIDHTPPTVTSLTVGVGGASPNATLEIAGAVSDNGTGNTTTLLVNGQVVLVTTLDSFDWTVPIGSRPARAYTIRLQVTDAAGNTTIRQASPALRR